jgi:putative DNA primase/helicase
MNCLGSGLSGPFQLSMFRTKRDDAPRPDILKAMPRRLIVAEEGSSEWNLHADVVKAMTSGGRIEARGMRSNEYAERNPAFTPVIVTNEWPEIKHADAAVKRRIVGIPFTAQLARGEDDTRLVSRFTAADYSGILAWIVRGYADYLESGIELGSAPPEVTGITEEIHSSMSPVDQFIADCCVLDPEAKTEAGELYLAYRNWWDENGKHGDPQNANAFGREISERTGYHPPKNPTSIAGRKVRMRNGIKIVTFLVNSSL